MVRSNVDLDVTVIESDGSTNHYIVPAASIKVRNLTVPNGFNPFGGKVRGIDGDYSEPLVSMYLMAGNLSLDEYSCFWRSG